MVIQTGAALPSLTDEAGEFDLDVSIVASGPVVADLMRNTDDNCGSTNQSACVTCFNS
jgi:FxLD family lantipeptide